MKRVATITFVILTLTCCARDAHATGYSGPMVYLDEGGKNVDASPEFYWDLELKRIAREFQVSEKRVKSDGTGHQEEETATVDRSEFEDALRRNAIEPPDVEEARKVH